MHRIPDTDWEIPVKGCRNCDVADSVCAGYRHFLKDIARGNPAEAQTIAMKGLDNDRVNRLGKQFHTIIKYAVQLTALKPDSPEFHHVLGQMKTHINELEEAATVRGWRGDVVKS